MRTVVACLICGLLACSGIAHAAKTKVAKTRKPARTAAEVGEESLRASRSTDQAKVAWVVADAEAIEADAKWNKMAAGTAEEKAAWAEVERTAANQVASARELKDALDGLGEAERGTSRMTASPEANESAADAELNAAFADDVAKGRAADDAKEAWKRAEKKSAALSEQMYEKAADELSEQGNPHNTRLAPSAPKPPTGGRFDSYLDRPEATESVTTFAPAPRLSWWCATNFFDHRQQACWQTKKECDAKDSEMTPYMDCREQETVTILEFTQVNRGPVFLAFPLLSQCESVRKALLKDKIDVRVVGRCHSSAVSAP